MGTYPGSLGRYAGIHLGLPVITIELPSAGIMPSRDDQRRMWVDLVAWLQAEPEAVVATTPALARLFTAELPLTARPIEAAPGWRVDLVRRADDPNRHFDAIAAALTANAPEGAFVDVETSNPAL